MNIVFVLVVLELVLVLVCEFNWFLLEFDKKKEKKNLGSLRYKKKVIFVCEILVIFYIFFGL